MTIVLSQCTAIASDEKGNTVQLKEDAIRDLMKFTNYKQADIVEVEPTEKKETVEKDKEEVLKKIRDLT